MGRNFTSDRPSDCRYCYFWAGKKKGCELGGEGHCYYLVPEGTAQDKGKCGGCPYGKHVPCIGFCLVQAMNKTRADYEKSLKAADGKGTGDGNGHVPGFSDGTWDGGDGRCRGK